MPSDWQEARRRDEMAARKAAQEAARDPEIEQATIAYLAYRTAGGQELWETFRRKWLMDRKEPEVNGGR
jgi:hypothetical protein